MGKRASCSWVAMRVITMGSLDPVSTGLCPKVLVRIHGGRGVCLVLVLFSNIFYETVNLRYKSSQLRTSLLTFLIGEPTKPFYDLLAASDNSPSAMAHNPREARETIQKVMETDADEKVLVVMAHD